MRDWKQARVAPDATITQAIEVLDRSALQICLVVDGDDNLLGTVTDGDVRRAILRGLPMSASVATAMQQSPVTVRPGLSPGEQLAIMTQHEVRQLPIVEGARLIGLAHLDALVPKPVAHTNWVVLMAGGLGTRLRPLTDNDPKPLLPVGAKPLLETIVESFIAQRFSRFYISVNFMGHKIKEYFGDGSRWNIEIRYLEETDRLGTAGALRLIEDRPAEPMIVMNADLLTRVDFQSLLQYHREHGAPATMCVREYDYQIPFGVVDIASQRITAIHEKPIHSCFVNAGIYVLEPDVIDLIPRDEVFDMPTLFERLIAAGRETVAFPLREYWLDVGRIDGFMQANGDYSQHFGQS